MSYWIIGRKRQKQRAYYSVSCPMIFVFGAIVLPVAIFVVKVVWPWIVQTILL